MSAHTVLVPCFSGQPPCAFISRRALKSTSTTWLWKSSSERVPTFTQLSSRLGLLAEVSEQLVPSHSSTLKLPRSPTGAPWSVISTPNSLLSQQLASEKNSRASVPL